MLVGSCCWAKKSGQPFSGPLIWHSCTVYIPNIYHCKSTFKYCDTIATMKMTRTVTPQYFFFLLAHEINNPYPGVSIDALVVYLFIYTPGEYKNYRYLPLAKYTSKWLFGTISSPNQTHFNGHRWVPSDLVTPNWFLKNGLVLVALNYFPNV